MTDVDPNSMVDAEADAVIKECLLASPPKSFFLYAGAGSGKTRSLVSALTSVREHRGPELWKRGQRVSVITYTNKAADEISRRLDFNALIQVSTIHSFAWDLLQGYTTDIKGWLQNHLVDEIQELERLQASGRAGSKAARDREVSIAAKRKRLASLPEIRKFIYSPTENKRGRGALAHAEVIGCVAALLSSKPTFQKILVSKFPVLLIDESQDTNKELMDALLIVQSQQHSVFVMGLIGDTMQRIYADGKVGLESAVPGTWAKPLKVMNHRSRERIVRLANRIRASVDPQVQQNRSDKPGGFARLFIFGSAGQNKAEAEQIVATRMAEITGEQAWLESWSRQTLILEHHMAAVRLRFSDVYEPLNQVERFRTGLLNGSLPALRFFIDEVIPFVRAARARNDFEAMAILRRYCPLLSEKALKEAGKQQAAHIRTIKDGASELLSLWDDERDPAMKHVVDAIARTSLFELPEMLLSMVGLESESSSAEDEEPEAPEATDELTTAWSKVSEVPFSQVEAYGQYVTGQSSFDTHQGVKGLQFKRVMVIIDDDAARGFMFSYDRVLGVKPLSDSDRKNESVGQDTTLDRTRRLLYVTCTRAEDSLAIVTYTQNAASVLRTVVEQGLFDEFEVEIR